MDDVRELLMTVLREQHGMSYDRRADAILERFDVTPKPVVTPEELGRIVAQAWYSTDNAATRGDIGKAVLRELAEAGLQIVRVSE